MIPCSSGMRRCKKKDKQNKKGNKIIKFEAEKTLYLLKLSGYLRRFRRTTQSIPSVNKPEANVWMYFWDGVAIPLQKISDFTISTSIIINLIFIGD